MSHRLSHSDGASERGSNLAPAPADMIQREKQTSEERTQANETARSWMRRFREEHPERRDELNEKAKKCMMRMRERQTPEERARENETARSGMRRFREEHPELRDELNEEAKKGMTRMRERQTPEERARENKKARLRYKEKYKDARKNKRRLNHGCWVTRLQIVN